MVLHTEMICNRTTCSLHKEGYERTSLGQSVSGMGGGNLPRLSMLNAATIGEVFSGTAGTDMAAADADSVGVVVCSPS